MVAAQVEDDFSVDDLLLDQSKLLASATADRGDVFLLNWLSTCEKAVEKLDPVILVVHQAALTSSLQELLVPPPPNSPNPSVKPGRPARKLIARILITLLRRGESRGLFDLGQALLKGLAGSDAKGSVEREKEWRVASGYCLSQLWLTYGNQIMSLFVELIQTATRIFRTVSFPVILRCAALHVLRTAICGGAKSMSDQTIKETLKALRIGLSDKAGAVVKECAECLLAMKDSPGVFVTLYNMEQVIAPAIKALDSANYLTRRALSHLIAGLLAQTQIEGSAARALPVTNKNKLNTGEEEDEDNFQSSAGAAASGDSNANTLLSPIEMLSQLSTSYNRPNSSRQVCNGLIDVYAELFTLLGSTWVESNFGDILKHLVEDIGCGPKAGLGWSGWNPRAAERVEPGRARFDAVSSRKVVNILLKDIIASRLLSEPGQKMAMRELNSQYLNKWPSLMPSQPPPSRQSLLIALAAAAGLLSSLGCAPMTSQDSLLDPLMRIVSHPSHSVQISAAWALRTFCSVGPTRFSSTIVLMIDSLNKDLGLLSSAASTTDVRKRAVGYAHALAALINLIPHKPLYVSFDLSAKCMSLAIQLLKQSGQHELHVSGVEIQVAWILVASLMTLGPNFVRLHLPQLLILWRNALPKATSKDASAAQVRGENEWAFLLHIRECTLGAILSFLRHNGGSVISGEGLVNEDVARRLVLLLSNGLAFSTSFTTSHATFLAGQMPSTSSHLKLVDRDLMLRRRLFQCFIAFGLNSNTQPFQVSLLQQVVFTISDAESYIGESSLQAAIGASAGTFTSIWDEVDGYGFGVTSLMQINTNQVAGGCDEVLSKKATPLNRDVAETAIEEQLKIPVLGALEHDALSLSTRFLADGCEPFDGPSPPPPASGVVDAGIELFSLYFPSQDPANQNALLQILTNNFKSPKLEKNPGRRMAILANAITAILGSLRHMMRGYATHSGIDQNTSLLMRDLIAESLVHNDSRLRQAGAECLGRLSSLGETSFMATQIQFCVTQVVNDTDPHNRAGCALAFGEIYYHVGSLAAGPVLKTIVDVLLSLSADPHPLVHYHALQALSLVIASASLSYAPYTHSTLGLLCKLYMQDTHEPEGGTPGSVNLRGDLPAYQAFCRVTDALIGVLGPELKEMEKVRLLILILLNEFVKEEDDGVKVEAIRATQHFLIFATSAMNLASLVATLRGQLSSLRQPLKLAAVNSVYQLVQRDAAQMSKLGGDGLVRELFALLDDDPSIEGVRDAITSWLRQTADANPSGWIDLCQRIMSRSTSTKSGNPGVPATPLMSFTDEESQGLGIEADDDSKTGARVSRSSSRWRTQLFALECLHEVFLTVLRSGRREHFDLVRAKALRVNPNGLLISRIADLIKMAFTASTAQVMEIRLEGLVVLRDVIENFSSSPDVDFEDALLLDQYQAPIAAALTPAFAADSYPEVLASAIQICAVFVGSGVVKEISKMGRILKLLTTALHSCQESDISSLGDVKDLSSTAAVMLKTSVFAAWAQFQIASIRQPYLLKVIEPHLPELCPYWVASLREYARMRTDPDATSSDSGAGGAAFDSVYSGLSRETALPFYVRSWPQMLHAVASLLKAKNTDMLAAIDGVNPQQVRPKTLLTLEQVSDAPALYFWVLFGLSFEALCAAPPSGDTSSQRVQVIALDALGALLQSAVAGSALKDKTLFEEVCNLCYRLAIIEAPQIKAKALEIVVQIADSSFTQAKGAETGNDKDPKMTQCLRIATCVLRESVPSFSSGPKPTPATAQAHVDLVKIAMASFADLADFQHLKMREDLYAIAFHFYSQLLKDETSSIDLVSPSLPALKSLCNRALTAPGLTTSMARVISGFVSASLQNIDGVRGRRGSIVALKIRNNLLASVLVLTSLPEGFKIGQEVLEHACFLLSETMLNGDIETAPTATHCLTSLISTASSRHTGVLMYCVGLLLPGIVEYIAQSAENMYVVGEKRLPLVAEVLKTFVSVLSGERVASKNRTQGLSLVIPVLVLLLDDKASNPPPLHVLAVGHLLNLAAAHPLQFREAASCLSDSQKKELEVSIRAEITKDAGGGRSGQSAEEAPRINLKTFG